MYSEESAQTSSPKKLKHLVMTDKPMARDQWSLICMRMITFLPSYLNLQAMIEKIKEVEMAYSLRTVQLL